MASIPGGQRVLSVLIAAAFIALNATPAGVPPAFTHVTTLASGPALQRPLGVAVDPSSGIVYVADSKNHQIKAITDAGAVSILAGSGVPGLSDGAGRAAQFHEPTGIAFDASLKVLYVADRQNHTIRQVTTDGVVTRIAGTGRRGMRNGAGATAELDQPAALAIAADGSLLVADSANHVIRRIAGGNVTTWAGTGQAGTADGPAPAARFASPEGIAIREDGAVFVADTGNHRIRMIASGVVSTVAGSVAGSLDGDAASARFREPHGLSFDESGALYVADTGNGTIRRIEATLGAVTTLAGAPERRNAPRPVDGSLATAAFSDPHGIAYAGALFVADARHDAVRVIEQRLLVTSVSPARGPRAGGTSVTINGNGFVPGTIGVAFGSSAATDVQYQSATQLLATTPAGSGAVDVTVSLRGRTATLEDAYTYASPPTVTSVSPAKGPTSGGQLVTIDGTEFDSSTQVFFGGVAAASMTVESPSRLTATTPAGAAGVAAVTVKTDSGEATLADAYTFAAAPVIASFAPVAARAGSTVTIQGMHFDPVASENQVFFAAAAAQVLSASTTQLTAVVPAAAASGRISVTTAGGTATSAADFTVVSVVSLTIAPPAASVEVGEATQLRAVGTRSDGSQVDVSADVTWSTTDTQIVALLASGAVRGLAVGTAEVKATLGSLEATASITVAPPAPLPPDPVTVAPPLDPTVSVPFHEATSFLYSGANPIQTGVDANAIVPERAAVIRGRVLNRDGLALRGVRVSIRDHEELGWTLSRANGAFDLAVNGGGPLVVEYSKNGFLPVHRIVEARWRSYRQAPDVVLLALDEAATRVVLNAPAAQVARGSAVSDAHGPRQATLFVPAGTTASMRMPDGTTRPLDAITVRATEYTIGARGHAAMPAALPPASGYTYCVELSADEAIEAGAASVTFNAPLVFYVENFLNFPVGSIVPAGYYDRVGLKWIASPNGRVIRILSVAGGTAAIDTNGDGNADAPSALAALGITAEEQARLTSLYAAGTSLWRVPIPHFTPWDCNWPYGPPSDAKPPKNGKPSGKDAKSNDAVKCAGSVIECENQTLGERIGIDGSPFTLNYRSDRVPGRTVARQLLIPVSGASVPSSLKKIQVNVSVEGKSWNTELPAAPNQTVTFTWDGRDAYERPVRGAVKADVQITYVYPVVYQQPANFAASFNVLSGIPFSASSDRTELNLFQGSEARIEGLPENTAAGIGGWSLSGHHSYNAHTQTLYLGDGERRIGTALAPVIQRFAGQYNVYGEEGNGGPALDAKLIFPWYVAAAPDGSVYISDAATRSVRKVSRSGIITHVAGNKNSTDLQHDGEPASSAALYGPYNMAVAPDGSLYIDDSRRIHRVSGGQITTVAGNGQCCIPSGDGGPARSATIRSYGIAVDTNGVLYIADEGVIRKVENGTITSITDPTCRGPYLTGRAATACVTAYEIAMGPDGLLYGHTGSAIWRITSGGMVEIVAGCASCTNTAPDGSSASSGRVSSRTSWGFDIGRDGTFYFSDDLARTVRAVTPDGFVTTIAGNGTRGFAGDGGPASAAQMFFPWGVAVGPDGVIYISDSDWGVVRKVERPFPSWSNSEHLVGSEDGEELYVFSTAGRHLRTIGRHRGDVRREFAYDANGKLLSVSDASAGTTTIQRDGEGTPVAIIAPGGQRTELALDDDGYLESVTGAAQESYALGYGEGGLLQSFTTPRGKTSTFVHSSDGALLKDTGSDVGTKTLSRTVNGDTVSAALTSSLGRTWSIFTERRKDESVRRAVTNAAGLVTQTIASSNGKTVRTAPDGTIVTTVEGADPRFGMHVPIIKELSFAQPSGLTYRHTLTRAVTLADKDDPFSVLTETDTYNVNGRVSTSVYDANARTVTLRSPLGRRITATVDAEDRVTALQVGTLEPLSFSYTGGQLTSVQNGSRSSSIGYDAARRVSSASDAAGRSMAITYDASGRMQTQTLSGARQIGYTWDATGNMRTLTTPNGHVHTFSYTDGDRLETYTPPQGRGSGHYELAYNGDGQVRSISQPNSASLSFSYDGAGRLETITGPQRQITYAYRGTGTVDRITAPGGSLAFTYDGSHVTGINTDGPIASSLSWAYNADLAPVSESVGGTSVAFGYDNDGLLVRSGDLVLTRDANNGTVKTASIGKLAETYQYNSHGELQEYAVTFDGTPLTSYTYGRDGAGRITTITRPGSLTGFAYDAAGRLQTASAGVVASSEYTYDKNGNRRSRTRSGGIVDEGTYDEQDRLIAYGDTTYTYMPNGELETSTTGGATTSFGYDSFGNLRTVGIPGMAIEYLVDAVNRRVGKKVNGSLTRGWVYADGYRIVAEVDAAGTVVSRFVYGTRANVPDYLVRGGETFRIIANHVGSPELVVNIATGVVVQRIEYDEFGSVLSDTNPGFQPFGFAGGLYDRDTGFVRFGARDYDARTGRWTTKDPLGFGGGDANLYAYVHGDPVNMIDPSGLSAKSAALCFLKGAAIGAAGALVVGGVAVLATTLGAPVAAVTLGLGALAVAGGMMMGIDVASNIMDKNWDGLAYNVGSLFGGAVAGGASGRSVAQGINGKPSGPFRLNDSFQNYKPGLGSIWDWLGTGPNVGSAAGSQAYAGAGAATAAAGNCGC